MFQINLHLIVKSHAFVLLVVLLGFSASLPAQTTVTLHADAGPWIAYVPNPDPYSSNTTWIHAQGSIGAGLGLPLTDAISFAPEARVLWSRLAFDYGSARSTRNPSGDLGLGFVGISPGFEWRPARHFSVRAGLEALCSAFTSGEMRIWYVDHDLNKVVTEVYAANFSRIRRGLLLAPELALGAHFPLSSGSELSFRLSGMLGLTPVFKEALDSPFNPRMGRLGLGIGYTFAGKSTEQ